VLSHSISHAPAQELELEEAKMACVEPSVHTATKENQERRKFLPFVFPRAPRPVDPRTHHTIYRQAPACTVLCFGNPRIRCIDTQSCRQRDQVILFLHQDAP
jgi:hypothetical protein